MPTMNNSVFLTLFASIIIATAVKAQELRAEYPEIKLGDRRVLTHATVDSFNGLAFCIRHDSGIEPYVRWEMMPPDWQKAFPRNAHLALEIVDKARKAEAKAPPPPIDLK